MVWKVDWRVVVDGRDMSDAMRPFLISVTVSDKDGTLSDTCSLDFDDSLGQISMPPEGGDVQVYLEQVMIFEGTVDGVRFNFSRGGGRRLMVTAKGFDPNGKVKENQSHHMDDASLEEFLGAAAERAGLDGISLDPIFGAIRRDYWSADGESFLHLGQRIARELNGTFKIRGRRAVMARRGDGASPNGAAMPIVVGRVGSNVISCDITPVTTRGRFAKTIVRYFDSRSATYQTVEVETGIEGATAVNEIAAGWADREQAQGVAEGRRSEAQRDGGEGSVSLDLDVEAQAEGGFLLTGARPGVDGLYRIVGVTHKADRSGGSTTSLELKQPSGDAGRDSRQLAAAQSAQ